MRLQRCLDRVHGGDFKAQEEMIELAWRRLLALADIILRSYKGIIKQEDKEEIFQKAMVRFWESMKKVTPRNLRDFFSLASLQIRRTLVDTIRHSFGPLGSGTNEVLHSQGNLAQNGVDPVDPHCTPLDLLAWTEFHQKIEELPEELREVFELKWYYELSHEEIAEMLEVSSRTVRSRWRDARIELFERLNGQLPN